MTVEGKFTFAEDFKTVTFEFKEDISETKKYFLIIAGFDECNGVEKMIDVSVKEIFVTSESSIYTSDAIDVIDCDLVKAFLWDGIWPVTSHERKNIH